jgi:type II secretory pathway pseudopilin PulG
VEVLLVVGILVALMAFALVASGSVMEQTRTRATKSIIERLKLLIEEYRSIAGQYPPDGMDFPVKNSDGTAVQGCAALHNALTSKVSVVMMVAGRPRKIDYDPVATFKEGELSEPDPRYPGAREILDGFGSPFHYDSTAEGKLRPQGGGVHIPPQSDDTHPPDPRTLPLDQGGVRSPGHVQSTAYDIWSYGKRGCDMSEKPTALIASWNLKD